MDGMCLFEAIERHVNITKDVEFVWSFWGKNIKQLQQALDEKKVELMETYYDRPDFKSVRLKILKNNERREL